LCAAAAPTIIAAGIRECPSMKPLPLLCLLASFAPPAAAAPAAAAAAAAPAAPEAGAAERARAALRNLDSDRLYRDEAYAREMLGHLDALEAAAPDAEVAAAIDLLRLAALGTLKRKEEALAVARRIVAANPGSAEAYAGPLFAAGRAGEPVAAIELLESAARNVRTADGLAALRREIDEVVVSWLWQELAERKAKPEKQRLAQALLTIGWPSPDRAAIGDSYRRILIDGRVDADPAAARVLAAEIMDPAQLVPLLVAHRYDPLFASDAERLARLDAVVAAFDRHTQARLEGHADDPDLLLDRAQFLRSVARDRDALALLQPWVDDLSRAEQSGEKGFWLVNEAAYALKALGRSQEAVAAMEQLIALDLGEHPYLINMAINHGAILNAAQRYADAAAYIEGLWATAKDQASPYGHMWMWSIAACAHAWAGESGKAAPWLERLKAGSDDNQAAHLRALLCANDMDAAEALLLKRLAGDNAADTLVGLQDYRLGERTSDSRLEQRMMALRSRPAVAAAIAAKGRILSLPLSKTYWGEY
jgi:hypothetical protein